MSLGLLPALVVATVCAGVFLVGSSFCLGPYVASLYPTRARTTGIGWALGIGRIGSVVSPLVGGFALAQGYEIRTILFGAGLPPILCGLLVLWLNRFVSSGAGGQPGHSGDVSSSICRLVACDGALPIYAADPPQHAANNLSRLTGLIPESVDAEHTISATGTRTTGISSSPPPEKAAELAGQESGLCQNRYLP